MVGLGSESRDRLIKMSDGIGGLVGFMATQENLSEPQLAQEPRLSGEAEQEARERIRLSTENCYRKSEMLSRGHPFPNMSDADLVIAFSKDSGYYGHSLPDTHSAANEWDQEKLGRGCSWGNLPTGGSRGKSLMHHQAVDAQVMRMQERTPAKFGILANDPGTGKTFTYLASVLLGYKELKRDKEAGKQIHAAPTLLLVEPRLLTQTFNEAYQNFHPKLTIYCLYGASKGSGAGTARRDATLDYKQWNAKVAEWAAGYGEPKNAQVVVISTYRTFSHRFSTCYDVRSGMANGEVASEYDRIIWGAKYDKPLAGEEPKKTDCIKSNKRIRLGTRFPKAEPSTSRAHQALQLTFSFSEIRFGRIIADEGQILRDPRTSAHRIFRLLPAEFKWVVTATPTQNGISDIYGLMLLFWAHANLPIRVPKSVLDNPRILMAPDYAHPRAGPDSFYPAEMPENLKSGLDDLENRGFMIYCLHPDLVSLVSEASPQDDIAQFIFKQADALIIRRGLTTPLTLPNGTVTYPGRNMPPYSIVTEHLAYGRAAEEVTRETEELLKNQILQDLDDSDDPDDAEDADDDEDLDDAEDVDNSSDLGDAEDADGSDDLDDAEDLDDHECSDDGEDRRAGGPVDKSARTVQHGSTGEGRKRDNSLTVALIRCLYFIACSRYSRFMMRTRNPVTETNPRYLRDSLRDIESEDLDAQLQAPRQDCKEMLHNAPVTHCGVEVASQVRQYSVDGPLSWIFCCWNQNPNLIPPLERQAMLYFILAESPVATRILEIVLDKKKNGKRTLILLGSPWDQILVEHILRKASLRVAGIYSQMSMATRERVLAD
ncbi:hypothetical protein RB595_001067 [Gaeumannomyces hyphopodioides]